MPEEVAAAYGVAHRFGLSFPCNGKRTLIVVEAHKVKSRRKPFVTEVENDGKVRKRFTQRRDQPNAREGRHSHNDDIDLPLANHFFGSRQSKGQPTHLRVRQ